MKIKIIYHKNCTDGFMAAFVCNILIESYIHSNYGKIISVKDDVEFIPISPNTIPNIDDIENSYIYIFDVAIPVDDFKNWIKLAKNVELYDHHISNKKEYEEHNLTNCYFDLEESGASLAYKKMYNAYRLDKSGKIFKVKDVKDSYMYWFVQYVKDKDLWKFSLNNSKEINSFIYSIPMSFDEYTKNFIDYSKYDINPAYTGAVIYNSEQRLIKSIADNHDYMLWKSNEFGTFTVPVVNSNVFQSEIGNILAQKTEHFAVVWYVFYQNRIPKVKLSLRSVGDFDVSVIAKELGGGGHKNAAGCSVDYREFNPYLLNAVRINK